MIRLTRLTGEPIDVNPRMIETVEQAHDTRLTLLSGRHLFVREHTDRVAALVNYRLYGGPPPEVDEPTQGG
jgi:uncharacterized protein YlzI (FlbEa/FlbD family)